MYDKAIVEAEVINITRRIVDGTDTINCFKDEQFVCKDVGEKKAILDLVTKHKLYYVLNLYCENGSDPICKVLKSIYQKQEKKNWVELVNVVNVFQKNNIEYVLVKGVAISNVLFKSSYVRGVGDIDLVVKEKDIDKAFGILTDMGFYRDGARNLSEATFFYGSKFHEISMVKNIDGSFIALELKRGTSCASDFSLWWSHVTSKRINGVDIKVLEDTCEILHLFLNTFANNESIGIIINCRLRDYFEVAYALSHIEISWDELLGIAEEMEVTHQVAIVLRSVKELYPSLSLEIDKILQSIQNDYCRYRQTLFYYGSDKIEKTNSGLVDNYPRAQISYSIYDKDFSTYQFFKSYKATLYSKKNPDYCLRSRLYANEKSAYFKYENEAGIDAFYHFENKGAAFEIVVDVFHNCKEVFENNRCYIGIYWFCNDINSPIFLERYVSPEIVGLKDLSWNMEAESQIDKQFFQSTQYLEIVDGYELQRIKVMAIQLDGFTRFCFEFDKEKLFYPLDVLNFEVKFMFGITGDDGMIEVELGTKENLVECLG